MEPSSMETLCHRSLYPSLDLGAEIFQSLFQSGFLVCDLICKLRITF